MKHYIITKFKEDCDWKAMVPQIRELFEGLIGIPGVTAFFVYTNVL